MRVLITGLPLFVKKIEKDLNEFDIKNKYIALNTYYSFFDKLRFFLLLPFSQMVISFNGVTDNSGTLNWAIFFKKKIVMQWMGTDSIIARKRAALDKIERKYIDKSFHFVDSPWLKEEVESLGLQIHYIRFKYGRELEPVKSYKEICILTYIPESRQDFYGLKKIIEAAKAFPEIIFRVAGMKNSEIPLPENITLLGWLNSKEMETELQNSPIMLRMTEHDGFSVSVIEALSVGAEVIWTHPAEGVFYVKDQLEMMDAISKVLEELKKRNNTPSQKNIKLSKDIYNREKLMKEYVEKLHQINNVK
mgnify:FL=1